MALIAVPGLEHLRSAPAIACYLSIIFCFLSISAALLLILNIGAPEKKIEHVEEGVSFCVIVSRMNIVFDYDLDGRNSQTFLAIDGYAGIVRTNQLYSTGIRFTRVRNTM